MIVVEMTDAVVRRRHHTLLGPIDLAVRPGEFLGVVGPNGSGKSTLLRLIAGLERPASGEVVCDGSTGAVGWRRRVGFLPQHHDFAPEVPFRVRDVVLFGRIARRRAGRSYDCVDFEAADEAMRGFGLEAMGDRLYRDLSGGERQKTQLARLVAQDADLLLLDEPTAGLDLDWQERMTEAVSNMHARLNRTIIMVTHEVHHLPARCDRVLLLRAGRIEALGDPDETLTAETLSRLYGCPMDTRRREGRRYAFSLGTGPQ